MFLCLSVPVPCSPQWHALSREEQAKYYELARKERQLHMQLYPGWSARDNYVRGPLSGELSLCGYIVSASTQRMVYCLLELSLKNIHSVHYWAPSLTPSPVA